ncbi:hypothetical protein [Limnobacter sp.]|jgi:hypothetical protein|uniref:hypothetical protein n=1 Tax=Limnobacter sp. TaxID=2003368 RepID=UPI00391A200D
MDINPITIIFTLIGGLILAGILGWVRAARLVVFVPRLFTHSKISDKGQIAELSVMNRGFKTEESIELILSPAMHYELLGSNNPDATLLNNKLSVPRIGSADDCSILLQVENGRFTHADIVSCLSKETKATVATKLEEVPVTAQQRVSIIVFVGVFSLLIFAGIKGIDYFVARDVDKNSGNKTNTELKSTVDETPPDLQGWTITRIYAKADNKIYQSIISKRIVLSTGKPSVRGKIILVPIKVSNDSDMPLTLSLSISASLSQDDIDFDKRRLNNRFLLPKDSVEVTFEAIVPKEIDRQAVGLEFFLETLEGETLKGVKVVKVLDQ